MRNEYVMANRYLGFITDKEFEECVENAMKQYKNASKIHNTLMDKDSSVILRHTQNTTDEFKTLFDIHGYGFNLEEWKQYEISRSLNLSSTRICIEFHLNILSRVKGWELINLTPHPLGARVIKNEDNSIFIEIRNTSKTIDGSSRPQLRERLNRLSKSNPDATIYHGYIISNNHAKNINKVFHVNNDEDDNEKIREISGDVIYKIVTGNSSAFYDTYKAVRSYLKDKYGPLSEDDEKILDDFQEKIFK